MLDLSVRDVKYLPGVGPARAELLLKELGIKSLADLIHYYPYKYIDRSRLFQIKEVNGRSRCRINFNEMKPFD